MTLWDTWKFFLALAALLVVLFVPLANYAGASLIEMGLIVGVLLLGLLGIQIAEIVSTFRNERLHLLHCNAEVENSKRYVRFLIAQYNAWVAHREYLKLKARRWELVQAHRQVRNTYIDLVFLNDRRVDLERERWEAAHAMTLEFWAGDPDFSGEEIEDMAYETAERMIRDYSKH